MSESIQRVQNDVEDAITLTTPSIFCSAAPQDEMSSEDENVLKYFIMLRPTGPTATILAKVCSALYSGGQQSVKDYCSNVLGITNKDYRRIFSLHERDALEAGTSWESFDITFLYKLLQQICGLAPSSDKRWAAPNPNEVDEIEHMLYLIKCERNFLAHEAVTLSDAELQERGKKLKQLLENILCKVSLRKKIDFSQEVKVTKMKIDEILNSTSKYSLQSYQQELEDLRQNIVKRLVANSQSELFPHYLDLWSSSLEQWFQVPVAEGNSGLQEAKIFTNVTIKDVDNTILSVEDIFLYRIKDGTPPKVLIIEGIAGIGKSYICKYILHKWASEKGDDINLLDIEIVIFIECHKVNSKSLREYLIEELLPKTCSTLRQEDVIPALQKCCVLFIVDGFDEAGSNARAILKELNTKFSNNRCIITCRPEFTEEAKSLMSTNRKEACIFFAKGFSDNQRKEYLRKILSIIKENVDDLESTIDRLYHRIQTLEHHLYTLLCLPLTLMMLVSLWLNDDDALSETTTVTRIHQQTVEMKIKQLAMRTQRKSGESRHISLIERTCQKWLKTLSKVAWDTLRCNTQILDKKCTDELIEEAENHSIDPMDALSCFMKCITLQKMFKTEYAWQFFHKSFQEYLTAFYISQNESILTNQMQGIFTKTGSEYPRNDLTPILKGGDIYESFSGSSKQKRANAIRSFLNSLSTCCRSRRYREEAKKTKKGERISCKNEYGLPINHSLIEMGGFLRPCAETIHVSTSEEDESPYSFVVIDTTKVDKLNTLQFLAAMETSKEDVNHESLRKLVTEYLEETSYGAWVQWATFIRECREHPIVCQVFNEVLNLKRIEIELIGQNISEDLKALEYILRKTKFQPDKCKLRFYRDKSLPEDLGHMLCTLELYSPVIPVDLLCNFDHCLGIQQLFNQMVKPEVLKVFIHGHFQERHMGDLISLLKYSHDKDANIELKVLIENTEDLRNLAHCCTTSPMPKDIKLTVWLYNGFVEMLTPLIQLFKSYRWQKPFSFGFCDVDMTTESIHDTQELLRKALHLSSVKLTKMELLVDAYAEYRMKNYEEMAQAIADDIPCGVVFESAADGDDVILVMEGVPQG
ncbi:uncharacterized protein [Palaemon carinicauda]